MSASDFALMLYVCVIALLGGVRYGFYEKRNKECFKPSHIHLVTCVHVNSLLPSFTKIFSYVTITCLVKVFMVLLY